MNVYYVRYCKPSSRMDILDNCDIFWVAEPGVKDLPNISYFSRAFVLALEPDANRSDLSGSFPSTSRLYRSIGILRDL